ncbi:MAG: hypothetical protein GC150_10270 [Rhizobiales bacterium]|nr:hypothetical protein [Hyphomicrobiales bacterium]
MSDSRKPGDETARALGRSPMDERRRIRANRFGVDLDEGGILVRDASGNWVDILTIGGDKAKDDPSKA